MTRIKSAWMPLLMACHEPPIIGRDFCTQPAVLALDQGCDPIDLECLSVACAWGPVSCSSDEHNAISLTLSSTELVDLTHLCADQTGSPAPAWLERELGCPTDSGLDWPPEVFGECHPPERH